MDNYIGCDTSNIIGSIFQYKDETGKRVNFYYTSKNDYFTLYIDKMPVCFRFKDIKNSKDVEVYIPREHKYKVDYELLFGKLRQMLVEFPIVQYVKDSFPLDKIKLDFIKNNCKSLSIIEIEGGSFMIDVKLSDMERKVKMEVVSDSDSCPKTLSTSGMFSGDFPKIPSWSVDDKEYYSMYNSLIRKLEDCFSDSGMHLMIGTTVSRKFGLKFYIVDDFSQSKSTHVSIIIDDKGICRLSNLHLEGSLSLMAQCIIRYLENLNDLDFVKGIVYSPSVDNKIYNALSRCGYSTSTGYLLPKSDMSKEFV